MISQENGRGLGIIERPRAQCLLSKLRMPERFGLEKHACAPCGEVVLSIRAQIHDMIHEYT